jgi:hypothetical protein
LEENIKSISVYQFLLFENNVAKYASAYTYNVLREREREREREIEIGDAGMWEESQFFVFWDYEIKKKIEKIHLWISCENNVNKFR